MQSLDLNSTNNRSHIKNANDFKLNKVSTKIEDTESQLKKN